MGDGYWKNVKRRQKGRRQKEQFPYFQKFQNLIFYQNHLLYFKAQNFFSLVTRF